MRGSERIILASVNTHAVWLLHNRCARAVATIRAREREKNFMRILFFFLSLLFHDTAAAGGFLASISLYCAYSYLGPFGEIIITVFFIKGKPATECFRYHFLRFRIIIIRMF